MLRWILAAAMIMALPAQAQVFKCIEGGKTVFSDKPCGQSAQEIKVKPARGASEPDFNQRMQSLDKDMAILREDRIRRTQELESARAGRLAAIAPSADMECDKTLATPIATVLNDAVARFANVESIASSTSRIALSGPLLELNRIADEVRGIRAVPGCVAALRDNAVEYVENTIEGLRQFALGKDYETTANMTLAHAKSAYAQYLEGRAMFGL